MRRSTVARQPCVTHYAEITQRMSRHYDHRNQRRCTERASAVVLEAPPVLHASTLGQNCEDHAEDCIRTAARTNDAKHRDALLNLAVQWRDRASALRPALGSPENSAAPSCHQLANFNTAARPRVEDVVFFPTPPPGVVTRTGRVERWKPFQNDLSLPRGPADPSPAGS